MICPRCCGTLAGPEWEYTLQGRTSDIWCLNCGWRVSHPTNCRDYSLPSSRILTSGQKAVKITGNKISRVIDLSKYVFVNEDER